ncbi:PRC-barrel domain containing protein [Streptomyces sp. BE303]|uniref:PRC-barrel domain containing protein n=1 Tax=Streptomycetaceae TaxID=2062 RepID=UPI002E7A8830|nr:PRC-barrel domain containing protein [Streptomyces sp. BE303]MED7952735.1 PRC-barrel domain containing protein [Streptomyces sp. BE303]
MTTDLWEYRPGSHHSTDLTLVGYEVEATDGPLGRVEQDAGDHLLVDTRPWVPGAPVLVPVGLVARIDHLELVVHLDCPRARIRSAPPPAAVDHTGGGLTAHGRAALDDHYVQDEHRTGTPGP